MLNNDLIKDILVISLSSSVITTAVIQKVKEHLQEKKPLWLLSLIISIILGAAFALTFSDLGLVESLWVGVICWIGSGTIYSAFENKIFKSYSNISHDTTVVTDSNTGSIENE